jgi:hypothetical protein
MHPDLFASILLGHMVGDYLLQNKWMAMNKSGSTFKCAVHCLLYTLAVCAFTTPFFDHAVWRGAAYPDWRWALAVFLSHFLIDRWSLADKWLDIIDGRSLRDFLANGHRGIVPSGEWWDDKRYRNYHALRGGFTSLVYAAADNTMHLVAMYYSALLLLSRPG